MKFTEGQKQMHERIKKLEAIQEERGIKNYGVEGWEERKRVEERIRVERKRKAKPLRK